MKTLEEFVNQNNGKYVEVTGSSNALNQCVDLVNAYLRDVCGLPIVTGTNAQDFPKKCLPPNYQWIPNETTAVPLFGDIIVWSSLNGVGHIAIVLDALVSSFNSFDQNWPVGTPCHVQHHVYTGTNYKVIGWLRPINNSEPIMTEEEKRILEFIKEQKANEGKVREAFGALKDLPIKDTEIQTLQARILTLENSLTSMEDRLTALESELKANLDLVKNQQSEVLAAKKELGKKNEELEAMTQQKNQYKGWYEKTLNKVADKLSTKELLSIIINRLFKK